MGGCDLGDQCKAYIRPVIRSVRGMRAWKLEKLVLCVNQARIMFNALQPSRKQIGIKTACEMIAMELITPFLTAKAAAVQLSRNKRKSGVGAAEGVEPSAVDKKTRTECGSLPRPRGMPL